MGLGVRDGTTAVIMLRASAKAALLNWTFINTTPNTQGAAWIPTSEAVVYTRALCFSSQFPGVRMH